MHQDVEKVIFTGEEIRARLTAMGEEITRDFHGEPLVVIGILKGVVYFMTELTLHIDLPLKIDFMKVTSYGAGTTSNGQPQVLLDISTDIKGKNVLLLDDILDTGLTFQLVKKMLLTRGPKSLKLGALMRKEGTQTTDMHADYVGFTCPNAFVVGYGLDYDNYYRNLDYVGILKKSVYTK